MKRTEPSPAARLRPAPIGTGHRPAWFERRHADGRYEQLLGPMRPTDHEIQAALLGDKNRRAERRREVAFTVAVAALGVIGFVVSMP